MEEQKDIKALCTLEDLEREGLKMYQLKDGFRFGTDTTLLAWFASCFVRSGNSSNIGKVTAKPCRVLELGSGCGACSLLILGRRKNTSVDAVELMKLPYEVLKENIKLNGLGDRLRAYNCDIRDLSPEVRQKQYDLVVFNPPFFLKEKGTVASEEKSVERLNGRFEENGSLQDFVDIASARVVPSSGFVVMVMKGNRLKDCLEAFSRVGINPERLLTVHSFSDKQASMILLAGKKGTKGGDLKILPPLIINERTADGTVLTPETSHIYNDAHDECFI